jgi:PAS domain S-box-containing protein
LAESDRGEIEKDLESALGILAVVLTGTSEGFWRVSSEGRLLDVNAAYCFMSGYSKEELLGKRISEISPFVTQEVIALRQAQVMVVGSAWFNSKHVAKDGRVFDVELHAIKLSQGGHSICFIRNISEMKQVEEKRQKTEARFRSLLEQAPIAIAMTRESRFLYVNPCYLAMHGFSNADELIGTSIFDRVLKEDLQAFRQHPELQALAEADDLAFEFRALRKDGTAFPVSTSVRTLLLDDGPAVLGFIQDISERKRTEIERENLIRNLREALDKVKTLRGLIPICSHCKKIRDDQGYWNQLEAYITHHSEAAFTHGVCPDCARTLFTEYLKSGPADT